MANCNAVKLFSNRQIGNVLSRDKNKYNEYKARGPTTWEKIIAETIFLRRIYTGIRNVRVRSPIYFSFKILHRIQVLITYDFGISMVCDNTKRTLIIDFEFVLFQEIKIPDTRATFLIVFSSDG